ncbi:MAG: MarR family winged helix-turn-helix transcriptional regulator, partial [Candidatus Omnitrophota bacterium]
MLETSEVVIRYVNEKGKATSKEIVEHVGLPRSSVLREITKLADSGQLVRVGVPPKDVFYICPSKTVEIAPQTQDSTRMVTPPEQVTVAPPAPQAV